MPYIKKFKFLEHISDAYVAAYGKSLEEAFENAALAMFETMTDTTTIEPKIQDEFEIKDEDEYSLLYSWLEKLLINFDVEGKLYSKFHIQEIKHNDKGYILKAKATGEVFKPEKHPSKVGIKAVTYHQMEIIKGKNNQFTVKFLLDI